MAIDKAASSLKDCARLGFGVIGCEVPFSEAYRGTVHQVLKVNATTARLHVSY